HHASYLSGWLKVLRQDQKALFHAAAAANRAAEYLTARQPAACGQAA
ncbi:MAG TPA: zincin-like metallopeptidase domain-containing protein, partial [bacterium]|nr:zincin-like metallopeptidase domain-containing protein [bacterium]